MFVWKTEMDKNHIQTVLIISEDAETVAVWETLFLQKNCSVIHETSPQNALQAARLLAPSLIILNLNVSHEERVSLCHQLRRTTRGTILHVSPEREEQEIYDYYLAGIDEHFVSPLNPMILLIKSMAWLAKQDWMEMQTQSIRTYV